MSMMFNACTLLESLDVSKFDTSRVEDMYLMFGGLLYLTSLDLTNFRTSRCTDMSQMFQGCGKLTSRQSQVTSNAWYTLDGRVVKTPLKGQLYIRGGNKVINTN